MIYFFRKVTIQKIFNFIKIKTSYFISILSKKSFRWGFPYSLSVEPTNICNLHCPECPSGNGELTRKRGTILFDDYKKIIDDSYKYLLNLFLYFQGEPFISKNIFEMIKYASDKNIYTATSTNGHFLSKENSFKIVESGLDKLIISLDGTTQDVYEQYRVSGNLEKVIEGIKNLIEIKSKLKSKTPFVELQFLVLGTNEHQKDDFLKLGKLLKVNSIKLKTAQIYDYENGSKFIPNNKKYSRYIATESIESKKTTESRLFNKYVLKKKLKNRCPRLWNSAVVTINGDVLPCCFDKDAKYSLGNIKKKSVSEIVNNQNFKMFANILLRNRKDIDICRNCNQ